MREGDTCRGIARRIYGDPEAYERIHAHNPELGSPPHALAPGTVLRLPRPEPPADLTAVRRRVERRAPAARRFVPARRGQPLPRGTQVRTHDDSSAEVTFRTDETAVTVRERTLVIVYGGQRRLARRRVTRAELERGALRSRLGELAGRAPLEVETPSSRASLDGDAVIAVEEDGTSRIANHGRRPATVEAEGRRVRLPGGTGTVVRRGERPTRPRRLLPAPRWRADQRGPVLGFVGRGATLSGGFRAVEGAARYRVEIARRPEGGDLLQTLELPGDARRFEADGLPQGTIYVSVASIDAAGLEGRRSPWRAFSVRLARLVAPGGAASVTERTIPRVWPGTWLVAPRGVRCGVEEARSGIVTLREPGRVSVGCHDGSGTGTEPLVVDVLGVTLEARGELVRDRTTEVRLRVVAQMPDGRGDAGGGGGERDEGDGASDRRGSAGGSAGRGDARRARGRAGDRERSASGVDDRGAGEAPAGTEGPPPRTLLVEVPEGFRASRPRVEGDVVVVSIRAPPGSPGRARVSLRVGAGSERVPLASIELPVRDAAAAVPAEVPDAEPATPGARRPVQGALGDLAWASALSLRDERRGGIGAWVFVAPVEAPGDAPQLRVGAGARAELPFAPLRLGFASQLDPLAGPGAPGRRGDADLLASVGVRLVDEGPFGAALDASAWLPTRDEPESLGRVRLAPSLEASWRPTPWLALRTRQGALVDADDDGARLWAWALGADVAPLEWLAVGLELDGSVGAFADRDGAALALGGGVEGRWGLLEVAAGARFALTDEARALLGAWATVLSVRVHAR
ncbi:MAG TPA: hypothetical protein RMH99_13760 [Sandaracinaceae bacterium LLY-WYZ-13_1]|nr:hypothetical protein [Sandaracinaceae bacterium LLY-WYZ-13_1]